LTELCCIPPAIGACWCALQARSTAFRAVLQLYCIQQFATCLPVQSANKAQPTFHPDQHAGLLNVLSHTDLCYDWARSHLHSKFH
jgi:hypothetical protein